MLIKITKSYQSFDVNSFLDESEYNALEVETIELMAKHSCDIHIDLSQVPKLKKFYLYGSGSIILNINNYTGLELFKLRGVSNCHNLMMKENLPIKTLQLTECNLHNLPSWIYKLSKLENLELQKNNLSTLPIEFEWLKEIKRINIDNNSFEEVPRVLANLESLNHLSCDGNKISTEQLQDFLKLLNA